MINILIDAISDLARFGRLSDETQKRLDRIRMEVNAEVSDIGHDVKTVVSEHVQQIADLWDHVNDVENHVSELKDHIEKRASKPTAAVAKKG